ncbi:MAG: hypothetical protein ACI9NN_002139, partial [Bacteroidia bacterium]
TDFSMNAQHAADFVLKAFDVTKKLAGTVQVPLLVLPG